MSVAAPRSRLGRTLLRLGVGAATVAGVIALLSWLGLTELLTVEGMRAAVESWGPLGPIAFIAIFVAGFFVPGPEILFAALGGALFGRVAGFCYAMIAAIIGTSTTFLLVRYTAQRWVQEALHARFPQLAGLDGRLERHGFLTVLALRLVLFLSPPLNWALGASRVPVRDYLLGTAIGVVPGLAIAVTLGDALGQTGSIGDLSRRDVVLPALLILGFLVVAVVAGRRLLARSAVSVAEPEEGRGEA